MNDNDLDLVLMDIIHSLKARLRRIDNLMKLLPYEKDLLWARKQIERNIVWYDSMITNHKLKRTRPGIKRTFSKIVYEVKFVYLRVLVARQNNKKEKKDG